MKSKKFQTFNFKLLAMALKYSMGSLWPYSFDLLVVKLRLSIDSPLAHSNFAIVE
jgi:hypothetical protein